MGGSTQLVDLPPGTWEEAQRWVGRELGRYRGADEVTLSDIRRRLYHVSVGKSGFPIPFLLHAYLPQTLQRIGVLRVCFKRA